MARHTNTKSHSDYWIIALASCAVILFEIATTRLLSVVLWYHFAFLAISVAMLAVGAPGIWLSWRPLPRARMPALLLAAGAAIPVSVALIANVYARMGLQGSSPNLKIALIVLTLLVPLCLLGTVVCMVLMHAEGRRVGHAYAADLAGAMLGGALIVPLMHVVPTPVLIAATALLPLAGALISGSTAMRAATLVVILMTLASFGTNAYRVRDTKTYTERQVGLLYEKWTPTSRLTVLRGAAYQRDPRLAFGWGFGERYEGTEIDQNWIDQDGSAGTAMTRLAGSPDDLDYLDFDVTSVGYQLRPPATVCVIGAGGGRDILTALRSGATHVDAVEVNPHMIDLVSQPFKDFTGDPYHLPGVHAQASEGRSFLTRTPHAYDLIQISLIDSWAATTAGAYALSENYLYTTESVQLYWSKLAANGLLSISRWSGGHHQLEGARLILMVEHALREAVEDVRAHVAVIQAGYIASVLVSRQPFTAADIDGLDAIAAERGFTRLWPPAADADADAQAKGALIRQVMEEGEGKLGEGGIILSPPTDDRPFFFQNVRAFTPVDAAELERLSINDEAARLPRFLIAGVGVMTLVLFFLPMAARGTLRKTAGFWRGSIYFLAIGAGFMLFEIPMIQKFILFLGHPSYATTVVLSALLAGTGLGALWSTRVPSGRLHRLRFVLPGAVALINVLAPTVLSMGLGLPLAARVVASVALIVPVGVVLGFAFPAGMQAFGTRSRAWYWAVNGAASVLATVTTLTLAAYIGLTNVVWLGVACYILAALSLPTARGAEVATGSPGP